jgi:hypothetical protein
MWKTFEKVARLWSTLLLFMSTAYYATIPLSRNKNHDRKGKIKKGADKRQKMCYTI